MMIGILLKLLLIYIAFTFIKFLFRFALIYRAFFQQMYAARKRDVSRTSESAPDFKGKTFEADYRVISDQ